MTCHRTPWFPRAAAAIVVGAALVSSGCAKDPEVAKREFVQSGDTYAAKDQLPEAIIQYRNAVQQDPRFGDARLKLGDAYLRTGDQNSALAEFVRAADLMPGDVSAQIKAGHLLLVARHFEEAQARADKALALAPANVDAQILLANALAGLRQLDAAVSEMEQAIQNDPERASSYASLGAIQLVSGNKAAAEAAFRKAVQAAPANAQTHLALANYYLAVQHQPEAETELKAALKINPQSALANRAMAYLYVGSGRSELAEPYLKAVADVTPDATGRLALASYYVSRHRGPDARRILERIVADGKDGGSAARLELANLDFSSGDVAASTARVNDVLSKEPSNTRALAARAELQASAGRLDDALVSVRKAVDSDAQSALARFALGKVQALRHDEADAVTSFGEALRLNPHLSPAKAEMARLYLSAGRVNLADQMAQSALADQPASPEFQLLSARVQLASGNAPRAEPALRALQKAFPNAPDVQAMVGVLELQKGNRPGARAAFEKALTLDRTNMEALRDLVRLDLSEKHGDAAKARVEAAMKNQPSNADLLLLSSDTMAAVGDTTEAERIARSVIEKDPNNLDAYASLGRLYVVTKQIDRATVQFQAMATRQPTSVAVHTVVGMLLQMQNRVGEAQASFEQALKLDPHAAVAANNLAWIYAEQGGNLDAALQLAQTAKAKLPNRPEVNDTLGWVYYKKEMGALAVDPLERAVEKDSGNASYLYHLGAAYAAAGSPVKARAALSKALAIGLSTTDSQAARQISAGLKG